MSASCSGVGSGTTAQSAKIMCPSTPHFVPGRYITKQDEAVLMPGAVFTMVSAARSTLAVSLSAPETMASARPFRIIMAPQCWVSPMNTFSRVFPGDALALAQLEVVVHVLLLQGRCVRFLHVQPGKADALLLRFRLDLALLPEEGDLAGQLLVREDARRLQRPGLVALGKDELAGIGFRLGAHFFNEVHLVGSFRE